MHIGPRPTFRGSPPTIELHLFDFEGELYGEEIRVEFIGYLRDVRPFASASALVEQLRADVHAARAALSREASFETDGVRVPREPRPLSAKVEDRRKS